MRSVMTIAGGVFMLIIVYLLVKNGNQTVAVINALASPSIAAIKTLQGR